MDRRDAVSALAPLVRHQALRVLLVAAPGVMAVVGTLTAQQANLAVVAAVNALAGIAVSSAVFIGVSLVARRYADERVELAQVAREGFWRARLQLHAIHHEDTDLYTDWYFRLRLEEEVERAKRYGTPFSVALIRALGLHQEQDASLATEALREQVRSQLRRSDLLAYLKDGSLALLMPNTRRRSARMVTNRIVAALAEAQPVVGLACYPEDGAQAETLLACARETFAAPKAASA